MHVKFSTICFSFFAALIFSVSIFGQIEASTQNGRPRPEELPKNIKETMAKQRIAREKKEYEELLQRTEEAVKLSSELEKSFTDSSRFSAEDLKKLDRLEKLVKKIRSDLGGNDDDTEPEESPERSKSETPETKVGAFKSLQSNASQLFDEIKKSTRYSVSVVAIQTSNALLKLVKFIRFGK